jgi:hypothetical protein
MSALPPKADIGLDLIQRAGNDPKRMFCDRVYYCRMLSSVENARDTASY